MKKFFALLFSAIVCIACAVGAAACEKVPNKGAIKVFTPDGAPALSLARNMVDGRYGGDEFPVKVVVADTIITYVSGENPEADVCILPVNAAVKALKSGEKYKMLGTITHGNLYLLKKEGGEDITKDNLSSLVGKTVGVINLSNVPGLTFKVILSDNSIQYNELVDGATAAADKVNLINVAGTAVLPTNTQCDYFVVPEPAASTKISATGGKLSLAGSLQTLYGGEGGYPQAVVVAKTELLKTRKNDILEYMDEFEENVKWLADEATTAETILNKITASYYKADTSPAFTAADLTKTVISNCGIKYVKSADCKAEVLAFMQKLNAVADNSFGTPTDDFFFVA